MSSNDIFLGPSGSEILLPPFGRKYSESILEFSRDDRTASARRVKDLYAQKRKFTIQYEILDDAGLRDLQTLYNYESELVLRVQKLSGIESYTVMLNPFAWDRVTSEGTGLWSNVALEMEEV